MMPVTSFEIYKDGEYHPEGLYSEVIFGPVRDNICSCGNFSTKIYEGRRCPKCNVICGPSSLRYTTFGKIELSYPIIRPSKLKNFIRMCYGTPVLDPLKYDMLKDKWYYLENRNGVLNLVSEYNDRCSRVRVSGVFSLYLAICDISRIYDFKFDSWLDNFTFEFLVTPPSTRELVILDSNSSEPEIIGNEITESYRRMIAFNNSCGKIDLDKIIESGIYETSLYHHDFSAGKLQYYANHIFKLVLKQLSGKPGIIRSRFFSKTIDFSSRSVISVNPSLKAYEIKLPLPILMKLYHIEFNRYLVNTKLYTKEKYMSITRSTEYLFNINHSDFFEFLRVLFDESLTDRLYRIVIINRQPTLWRYGITGVEVVGYTDGNVIEISPLLMEQMNADCDGDTSAVYRFHDIEGLKEIEEKNFNLNCVVYDHNYKPIHKIRLEAYYIFKILVSSEIDYNLECIEIESLNDLKTDLSIPIRTPIKFKDKIYSYGLCLINKLSGFSDIVIDRLISNEDLSDLILKDSSSVHEYHDRLHNLMKYMFLFVSVHPEEFLTLPFDIEMVLEDDILENLPNNPFFGIHLTEALTDYIISGSGDRVLKLIGTKLSKKQIERIGVCIGYIADYNNNIINTPIRSSLMSGLNEDEFFLSCFGSRKGFIDRKDRTPESGYLERTMTLNLSPIELIESDCSEEGDIRYFKIRILSDSHLKSLYGRWYRNGNSESIIDERSNINIGDQIEIRSPIYCKAKDFKVCRKCFGNYYVPSERIGILAAKYISERFTQLTLRTFHTSGSCSIKLDPEFVDFIKNHLLEVRRENGINYWRFNSGFESLYDIVSKYPGFIRIEGDCLIFRDLNDTYENDDISHDIKEFKKALMKTGNRDSDILSIYEKCISILLKNSKIFSTYLEIVLCNMFIGEDGNILRYSLDGKKSDRYSIKTIHNSVNPVLGLLYEPNLRSILNVKDIENLRNLKPVSIFEKLWLKY
ncbi:MAG: hypothetical protein QXD03_02165 [Candidatus Anstonellales archaeon]